MNSFKKWFIILRAYSWPASIVPLSVASAYSYKHGWFNFHDFFVILISGFLIHISGNLFNTYYDFVNGVDREGADDIGIVRGLARPENVLRLAFVFMLAACIAGFYLIFKYSLFNLLFIAVPGVVFTYFYTANPLSLKYRALGELVIFLCFGPLIVMGSVMIFKKDFDMRSIIYSLPSAFLIVNLLLSNNIRDYSSDKSSGIKTIVDIIGIRTSKIFYLFLHAVSYLVAFFIIGLSYGNLAFFICLPLSIKIIMLIKQSKYTELNRESAKFILVFGIVFISLILWG